MLRSFPRGIEHGCRRWCAATLALAVIAAPTIVTQTQSVPHAAAAVSAPSWWAGDCDATWWNARAATQGWHGPGVHRLGAVVSRRPGVRPASAVDGAPDVLWRRPGWGELEFECVELAMRFMSQIYGVTPYNANGDTVVKNYTAADGGNLVKVANGTVGRAPQPGDVISFNSPGLGHVGVVTASSVDTGGNGSITMLSQNDTANGWRTLAVANWKVASFGDQTPYGWLHDPQGRGGAASAPATGGYWMLAASGTVYPFGTLAGYAACPGRRLRSPHPRAATDTGSPTAAAASARSVPQPLTETLLRCAPVNTSVQCPRHRRARVTGCSRTSAARSPSATRSSSAIWRR